MSLTYKQRLGNYLEARPNESSAPELTHLTPAQKRRLHHKLHRAKAVALRKRRERDRARRAEKKQEVA